MGKKRSSNQFKQEKIVKNVTISTNIQTEDLTASSSNIELVESKELSIGNKKLLNQLKRDRIEISSSTSNTQKEKSKHGKNNSNQQKPRKNDNKTKDSYLQQTVDTKPVAYHGSKENDAHLKQTKNIVLHQDLGQNERLERQEKQQRKDHLEGSASITKNKTTEPAGSYKPIHNLNQQSERKNNNKTKDDSYTQYNRDRKSDAYSYKKDGSHREETRNSAMNQDFRKSERADEEFKVVKEIQMDLFEMDPQYSLAHCVAEDMKMGSGIAVTFRQKFKRVDELLGQHKKTGGLAVLDLPNNTYVYYLITKKRSEGKPTYDTLFSSLQALKQHIIDHNVTKLAIPRIGCGLDRLEWRKVKKMIENTFQDNSGMEIIVCNFQQNYGKSKNKRCKKTGKTEKASKKPKK